MRKRYRVLVLLALTAAFVVPVGFALSLEAPISARATSSAIVGAPAFQNEPDAARLLVVGLALFGLAAFVRKTG